jgi:mannosidase alpha-like ER degradation enhancer 2
MELYRNDSAEMFHFSFQNYMQHAFPRDDLRPISCRGSNSQGGIALSLLDSLDALVIFDNVPEFQSAVQWVTDQRPKLFNVDARVHVFEVTIRALGGLLSAHSLLQLDPTLAPDYDGHSLLDAAVDLADRLMPAFDTPTGLPLSWVNLKRGQVAGDTRVTCTACAGTLLLEFGVLSRLTGNETYEYKSRHAVEYLWSKRSARGLLGNTINVDSGRWLRRDAGIGAGVDSFYEYLLKSYLAFGDRIYLDMFAESYAAAQAHLALSSSINGVEWLVTVHMATGRLMNHYISSLAAFWPGMQALTGQISDGLALHSNWTKAWDQFGWLPESFSLNLQHSHPTMANYPLRPELIESTYLLHATTGKDDLLHSAVRVLERLRDHTRVKCGHASVGDIGTSRLEDTMESFFLSETSKYLYLLFANATKLIDHYVLSTEGHLFPPFGVSASEEVIVDQVDMGGWKEQGAETKQQDKKGGGSWFVRLIRGAKPPSPAKKEKTPCSEVCDNLIDYSIAPLEKGQKNEDGSWDIGVSATTSSLGGEISAAALREALPRIPASASTPSILRQRRCTACKTVTSAVTKAKKRADDLWRLDADSQHRAGRTHVAPAQWARNRVASNSRPQKIVLCVLGEAGPGKLHCILAREILSTDLTSQAVQSVVQNAVFFQISGHQGGITAEVLASALSEVQIIRIATDMSGNGTSERADSTNGNTSYGDSVFIVDNTMPSMLAEFGPDLLPGCNSTNPKLIAASLAQWEALVAEQKSFASVDNEEPTEEGETEEDVLRKIAAAENAGGGGDTSCGDDGSGSCSSSSGIQGEREYVDLDDDDPYVDPDELEAAELIKKPHLEEEKSRAASDADPEICSQNEEKETLNPKKDEGDPSLLSSDEMQGISVEYLERFHAAEAAAAAVAEAANAAKLTSDAIGGDHAVCQVLGRLVPTSPYNACSPIVNSDALRGNIAIIQRGNCSFQSKVLAAEIAGAVGAVIVNADSEGVDGRSLMPMGLDSSDSTAPLPIPRIPSVMVRAEDGLTLITAADQGRWARLWDPPLKRKLEMGRILIELAKAEEIEQKKMQAAASAVAKEAAEKLKEQLRELKAEAAAGADGGGESHNMPENAAADPAAAATSREAASAMSTLQLDVIVPPNSHPWVMHALYQQKLDMVLAFQTAAKMLAPSVDGGSQESR